MRRCACWRTSTRPASRSTRRCRDTPGRAIGRRATSSPAVPSPSARASTSVRRLSSASALKTASIASRYRDGYVTVKVHRRPDYLRGLGPSSGERCGAVRELVMLSGPPTSVVTATLVRGHEKVPTGGQVQVPAGGQVEVPALRVSCPGLWALCGDGGGANQITGHRTGASIEEREGTDGRIGRLPGGGQLPGCGAAVRHHAQDGQADRGAVQRRRGGASAAGAGAQLRPGG